MQTGRLSNEKSLYLKQHKDNPVAWYPYTNESIEIATKEDKPIFLSIGYSSCHWCHVMAHESFEDKETAKLLNDNFICIKVDREEFPDIDQYYQSAAMLFGKEGGWPLSAFLLPNLKPYFIGTYFPKERYENRPSFKDVILEMANVFQNKKSEISSNGEKVEELLLKGDKGTQKVEFNGHFPHPMAIVKALSDYEDKEFGGHGDAPKFFHFSYYEWAIEQTLEGMIDKESAGTIIKTIEMILLGGVYDHLRGGIHRYSTDRSFTIPHFEKMLYDQAGLISVLAKAINIAPSPLLLNALHATLVYLKTEMMSEENYFFSSQSADSDEGEGFYFTFTEEEFLDALIKGDTEDERLSKNLDTLKKWFKITPEGNFHSGLSVISLNPENSQELFTQENWQLVLQARAALLKARQMRTPPACDTKGIASWNFLLLLSLLDVIQYCKVMPISKFAFEIFNIALEGIYKKFLEKSTDGKIKIHHSTTRNDLPPFFEDFVFFAAVQLRTYELTGNKIFKDNFMQTLGFIKNEFVEGDSILTRAKFSNDKFHHKNLPLSPFDLIHKSPVALYLSLLRREAALTLSQSNLNEMKVIFENATHLTLKNPLAGGEALRALSYPEMAYKRVTVPKSWNDAPKFRQFLPFFMPRFVVNFHEDQNDHWEICSLTSCEKSGTGVDSFIESLTPKK